MLSKYGFFLGGLDFGGKGGCGAGGLLSFGGFLTMGLYNILYILASNETFSLDSPDFSSSIFPP